VVGSAKRGFAENPEGISGDALRSIRFLGGCQGKFLGDRGRSSEGVEKILSRSKMLRLRDAHCCQVKIFKPQMDADGRRWTQMEIQNCPALCGLNCFLDKNFNH